MVDIKSLTLTELEELQERLQFEIKQREEERFNRLVQTICDAMDALKQEFPYARCEVEAECPDCDCEFSIDILSALDGLIPSDFHR